MRQVRIRAILREAAHEDYPRFALAQLVAWGIVTIDARQPPPVPIAVESVRVTAPLRDDSPLELSITVRNTGSQTILAWGVSGEVSYANGATRSVRVSTDTYETLFLRESLRPPPRVNRRLPPGAEAIIATNIQVVPLTEAIGGTAVATFAVFEDDTAAGDDKLIDFTFARRRVAQRTWRFVDEAMATASGSGRAEDEVLESLAKALDGADKELQQSYPFFIVRSILAWKSFEGKLQRIRDEITAPMAAADRHAQRRSAVR